MRHSLQHRAKVRRGESFTAFKAPVDNAFEPQDAVDLQAAMIGSVVLASTENYDDMRLGFIRTYESQPQMICYCEVPRDVQLSVEFARKHGLSPVCRSSGHSTAGYSVNDQLVIDLSRISYVVVDEEKRTAIVGAGTNFEKVDAVLAPLGLHIPTGGCPSVTVAGYMQGGGYGFTSQMFGMNCDNVIRCSAVAADGKFITADEKTNSDLFWAFRGGTGNNFGVLLEITYRLHELHRLQGFGLCWELESKADREHAAHALSIWQSDFTGTTGGPRDVGTEVFVVDVVRETSKPARPQLLIRGMHRSGEPTCKVDLQPLADLCPDGGNHDIWRSGTYEELNEYLFSYPTELPEVPPNIRAVIESRIVAEPITVPNWLKLLDFFRGTPPGAVIIGIESYGGAINQVAPDETAFVHRRALMDVFMWSFWMNDEQRQQAEQYIQEFRALMDPLSNGRAYQNYPNRSTPPGTYPQLYWGENYARLQDVKAQYDPTNVFQFPQMVYPPAPPLSV